ncbi:MAG: hypothetical protein ABIZ04_13300 [Opitutus sp.]
MIQAGQIAGIELLDTQPAVNVIEAEYWRLLGYPPHHEPSERARELAAWARAWYAEHGRPWLYLRQTGLKLGETGLSFDDVPFTSPRLLDHLQQSGAQRAMLVAVSAGRAAEEHARQLWQDAKPDEYFFLEVYGSAVVEHLCASLSGRICELADRDGLMAVPHYSPGYTGWDITDQQRLFELIEAGRSRPFPEDLQVLSSGMLKPKKSLLAVVGLAPRTEQGLADLNRVPCVSCALTPCVYRRASYQHAERFDDRSAPVAQPTARPLTTGAAYTVGAKALAKWAGERVRLASRNDGSVEAAFRFEGTTCSNMGRFLAFDYQVELSSPKDGYRILRTSCSPVPGEDGYEQMCAYLSDPDGLMEGIAVAPPLLGQPLDHVLTWSRDSAPSGCYCTESSRTHKWGLALEAIHYALAQRSVAGANDSSHPSPRS